MGFPTVLKSILAVLWTAFIVYGLLSEPSGVPKFQWLSLPGMDKLIHGVLFSIESGLIIWVFSYLKWRFLAAATLLWCFVLGGGLELMQYFWVEGRSGQLWDLIADMTGSVLGLIVFNVFFKK